jgi:hypothetical protein
MADALAAGTALEKVPKVEVLVGEIDSTMSDLMLAARQAENLRPLTEEEADGMTVAQLGDRAALIFSHYKCTLMSERDFILRFRVELDVLRRKTTQQGRRLPIPGCPTWGEVKKTYFKLSGRRIDALLADPKPSKKEPEPEPTEVREITVGDDQPETPTPSNEAAEKIQEAARGLMEEKLKSLTFSTDLRTHLLASFPDIVNLVEDEIVCSNDRRLEPMKEFFHTLPPHFLDVLASAAFDVREENDRAAEKKRGEARRAAILEVLQKGKSLGATQVMEEIEKNPDWEKWGSHDEYYQAMKLGIGSDWFKRGRLYNIAPSPKKEEKLTVDPEAIAQGDFSGILAH